MYWSARTGAHVVFAAHD
ncbi:hypothetical protein [Nocardia sp. NPDC004604]